MNIHANAALTPRQRERLARRVLEDGLSLSRAAMAAEVSEKTAGKWSGRYRSGEPMLDRSSAPKRVHNRTPKAKVEAIRALRRVRFTGPEIGDPWDADLDRFGGIEADRTRQALEIDPERRSRSLREGPARGADSH